jgi:hypothetical protein
MLCVTANLPNACRSCSLATEPAGPTRLDLLPSGLLHARLWHPLAQKRFRKNAGGEFRWL